MAARPDRGRPQRAPTPAGSRWSTSEVAEILWLTWALRDRRDDQAQRFWVAVDCFALTAGHPIERRKLRREVRRAYKREYGQAAVA